MQVVCTWLQFLFFWSSDWLHCLKKKKKELGVASISRLLRGSRKSQKWFVRASESQLPCSSEYLGSDSTGPRISCRHVWGQRGYSSVFHQELELLRPRKMESPVHRKPSALQKDKCGHTHSGRQTPARFLSWPCAGHEQRMAHCEWPCA